MDRDAFIVFMLCPMLFALCRSFYWPFRRIGRFSRNIPDDAKVPGGRALVPYGEEDEESPYDKNDRDGDHDDPAPERA